jgi:hypothetical protein
MVGARLLVLGTVAGVAVKSVDGSFPDWLRDVGNSPAVFVFALAVIARMAGTVVLAAVHSGIFFASLCTAYYAWSTHALGFGGGRFVYLWGGLAVTLVPVLAATVRWAVGRSGLLPAAVVAAVAGVAAAGAGEVRQLWRYAAGDLPTGFPLHPTQAVIGLVIAVVIAGALPRDARTRIVALLLTAPMAWAASGLIDRVYETGLLS